MTRNSYKILTYPLYFGIRAHKTDPTDIHKLEHLEAEVRSTKRIVINIEQLLKEIDKKLDYIKNQNQDKIDRIVKLENLPGQKEIIDLKNTIEKTQKTPNIEEELSSITKKINNLTLKPSGKEYISRKDTTFKFPAQKPQ